MFFRYVLAVIVALLITYIVGELMALWSIYLFAGWGKVGSVLIGASVLGRALLGVIGAYLGAAAVTGMARNTFRIVGVFLIPLRVLHLVGLYGAEDPYRLVGLIGAWLALILTVVFTFMSLRTD